MTFRTGLKVDVIASCHNIILTKINFSKILSNCHGTSRCRNGQRWTLNACTSIYMWARKYDKTPCVPAGWSQSSARVRLLPVNSSSLHSNPRRSWSFFSRSDLYPVWIQLTSQWTSCKQLFFFTQRIFCGRNYLVRSVFIWKKHLKIYDCHW